MKWKALIIPIVAGVALCACASTPAPVPVAGDASLLAGKWEGVFSSNDGTRSGTIFFELQAGRDTAYGDVLMVPREWRGQHSPWEKEGRDHPHPELLGIRFVQVSGNLVRGTLELHRDPVSGGIVRTVFDGTLDGNAIAGSYYTFDVDTQETRAGTWKVRRSAVYADSRINRDHLVGEAQ